MMSQRRTSSRIHKAPQRFESPEPPTRTKSDLIAAPVIKKAKPLTPAKKNDTTQKRAAKTRVGTSLEPTIEAIGETQPIQGASTMTTKATIRMTAKSSSAVVPKKVSNKRPTDEPPSTTKKKLSSPATAAFEKSKAPTCESEPTPAPPKQSKSISRKHAPKVDFLFTNNNMDPIIENLREISMRYKRVPNIDSEILDHVALEGLTGITFSRLCLILDAVAPKLNLSRDAAAQNYIWSVLVGRYLRRVPGARVQVFHNDLAESANPSTTANNISQQSPGNGAAQRRKDLFIDKQMTLPSQSLQRMGSSNWILQPIQDGVIMGSCPNYSSRVYIGDEVITLFDDFGPRQSLLEVHHKYNLESVYFVADQEIRRRALLPSSCDPNIDIKLREYVCLELIGRTRYFGIVFPNDKALGRYRILLSAKGLITQYQQTCNTYIIHHIRRLSKFILDQSMIAPTSGESKSKAFKLGLVGLKQEAIEEGEEGANDDLRDATESFYDKPTVQGTCCDPARLKHDKGVLRMVYDVIAVSRGRSVDDIRRILRLPKSHVRNHIKNLANIELVGSHTRIIGASITRLYRARHRSIRRRVARQKKVLKGVQAKWDAKDLQAREMLGLRRSQFSQAEDSLLILCHITGLLINPKYSKSFLVSKQVVRDILHEELDESHDKTSDALLRRAKFLRASTQNLSRINELLADLRDNHDIVRLMAANRGNISNNDEKLKKFFKQLLKVIRANLPHLLGLTATSTSSPSTSSALLPVGNSSSSSFNITNYKELREKYKLADCGQDDLSKKVYNQPNSTMVQLVHRTELSYRFRVEKCDDGMQTIMLLASRCVQSCFNLSLMLKVPVRVVALDEESENYKEIKEKSKDNKETSRLIENLTTPFPTADSRRALFMLRNALKIHNIDKGGKLSDALIVQPCHIEFSAEEELEFNQRHLLEEFLEKSKFFNELIVEDKRSAQEDKKKRKRTQDRKRLADAKQSYSKDNTPPELLDKQPTASTSGRDAGSTTILGDDMDEAAADGKTNYERLLKMIEAIMSWVSNQPGIELELLQTKLDPLLGKRNHGHLNELLELMESLELISRDSLKLAPPPREPRLFGYKQHSTNQCHSGDYIEVVTLAPRENVFVRLCQLADVDL